MATALRWRSNLVKTGNPCTVKPKALDAAVRKYSRSEGVFEATSFGLVAQCGGSPIVLRLPISQTVDLDRLRPAHPTMAGLWDLASEITGSAFGPTDVFHDRSASDYLARQHAGEMIVPDLTSGAYDEGLAAAVQGNVGNWKAPKFPDLLADYRGPVSASEAQTSYVPRLLVAATYPFSNFVEPKYPLLAMQARIQGKVELRLTSDPATGLVLNVEPVSGHPLLRPGAIDAARQWRFKPNPIRSQTVTLTLEYALQSLESCCSAAPLYFFPGPAPPPCVISIAFTFGTIPADTGANNIVTVPFVTVTGNDRSSALFAPPAAVTISKLVSTGAPLIATLNIRWPACV